MSEHNGQQFWGQLLQLTSSWKAIARPSPGSSSSNNSSSTFPPLNLTTPLDVSAFLTSLNLSGDAIAEASLRIHKTTEELKAIHTRNYEHLCRQAVQANKESASQAMLYDSLRRACQASFHRQLPRIKEEFLKSYQHVQHVQQRSENKRTPFNPEYTPLLEKYFEHNAYPSPGDREWLARKTMMSFRQIEVWFQNHRRRARKEGRQFTKLPVDHVPARLSLEALELNMPPMAIPQKQDPVPSLPASDALSCSHSPIFPVDNILDSSIRPAHAFPKVYSKDASFSEEPFPCKSGIYRFPPAVWPRDHGTSSPRATSCTIDELCETFMSQLRIFEGQPKVVQRQSGKTRSWFASRCIGPILAPHPALLRSQPLAVASACPSVPDTPSPNLQKRIAPVIKQRRRQSPTLDAISHPSNPTPSLPSTRRSRPISRVSSNSSLSSQTSSGSSAHDPDTPDSSPSPSRALSLPSVYGIDDSFLDFQQNSSLDAPHASCDFIEHLLLPTKHQAMWPAPRQHSSPRHNIDL
ncbi:hypothetical protein FA15DRAFT_662956 [Coprinopsis marcescibilis]|uniref:Homeobox domain-containing protein n=1 Tax=Coprinopsis marcescibilis TaxID=230819 RepID=A0A5C3LDP6_COPMA|nr:hypothetical protein FA15DRAFT_662956 [Coprinopsis marcescibilis]